MRRYFILCFVAILFAASASIAQQKRTPNQNFVNYPVHVSGGDALGSSVPTQTHGFPGSHLSPMVSIPGANPLPFSTKLDAASNGRSLHTLVRDPDDLKKLHFVAMVADDNTADDTVASAFTSRRVAYTYSSDGGKTWTPQIYIDSAIRLGYPDIVLYKRGGVNVPIIAAHNGPNGTNNANWTTKLYIEQGNPGDGKFKKFTTDQKSSSGKTKDIGYPSIALSPNQDTLFMLGCILTTGTISSTNPTQPLEFGMFTLDPSRSATWLGWKTSPSGTNLKGHVTTGKDILHMAPNGTLGAMWCSDSNYVCYVESIDDGKTWTPTYTPLYKAPTTQIAASDGITYDCVFSGCDGMDFWYDQTSVPTFMWEAYWDSPSGIFFPLNSTAFFTWRMGSSTVAMPVFYNDPGFTTMVMFDTLTATVNELNSVDYFTPVDVPAGNPPRHQTTVWNPTAVITSDPNKFGVVYETFQDGDILLDIDVFGDGTVTEARLFRDIYSTMTTDGGATWSAPTPYAANDPAIDASLKIDYHFPSTPVFNPEKAGSLFSDVLFLADTCPGPVETGEADWDDNTWFHQTLGIEGVHSSNSVVNLTLSQNYPNPFNASTTIPLAMKNDDMVTLSVSDILGREVAVVYHGRLAAGEHNIPCSMPNLGAGIYTYSVKTSSGSVSRTMSVVK